MKASLQHLIPTRFSFFLAEFSIIAECEALLDNHPIVRFKGRSDASLEAKLRFTLNDLQDLLGEGKIEAR